MNLASFDLNLLRVLDALLREGSTVGAARAVGLSQPAVSAALGRLRAALGDELFLRQGARLIPTTFAESLAQPLRELLDGLPALLTPPTAFDPAGAEGVVRLAGIDLFAEMLMPDLARVLTRQAPGVKVQLLDLVPDNYVQAITAYEVDLTFAPRAELPGWLAWAPLFHAPFVLIARAGHPDLAVRGLRPGEALPLDLYCALPHVLCSPDGRLHGMSDAALGALGRRREVVMSMPYMSGVAAVVAQSDMISMIPRQLAERLAPRLGLVLYRPPFEPPAPLITMIWHRRTHADPLHRWLRGLVSDLLTAGNAAAGAPAEGGLKSAPAAVTQERP